jgi:hypothetical protein
MVWREPDTLAIGYIAWHLLLALPTHRWLMELSPNLGDGLKDQAAALG